MNDLDEMNYPIYKTKSEVLRAAHENKCYYVGFSDEPFKEALTHSWKFYKK